MNDILNSISNFLAVILGFNLFVFFTDLIDVEEQLYYFLQNFYIILCIVTIVYSIIYKVQKNKMQKEHQEEINKIEKEKKENIAKMFEQYKKQNNENSNH